MSSIFGSGDPRAKQSVVIHKGGFLRRFTWRQMILTVALVSVAAAGVLFFNPAALYTARFAPVNTLDRRINATSAGLGIAVMSTGVIGGLNGDGALLKEVLSRPAAPLGKQERTINIEQMTSYGNLQLTGRNPSITLFMPVPEDWQPADVVLELKVNTSAQLLPTSALSVMANGNPASTLPLNKGNTATAYVWLVTIPRQWITTNYLGLTFSGTLRTANETCASLADSEAWATIAQESIVRWNFDRKPLSPDLGRFPFPFFRARSPDPAVSVMVLPDQPTGDEVAAALPVAGYLGQFTTARGYSTVPMPNADLTSQVRSSTDLILVGRPSRLPVLRDLAPNLPFRMANRDQWIDKQGKVIGPDSGILMEIQSPWNPTRAILVATGSSDEAVRRAATALTQTAFSKIVRGQFALITEAPTGNLTSRSAIDWNSASFQDLGYSDQIVRGLGNQTLSIYFDLPAVRDTGSMNLDLKFRHSSFISHDNSSLNVTLNDKPVRGVRLTKDNEENGALTAEIPAQQLQRGANVLKVQFYLYPADGENCVRMDPDRAWAMISPASSVGLRFGTASGKTDPIYYPSNALPDLIDYPTPFDQGATIVLPNNPGQDERAGAFLLATNLGRLLSKNVTAVQVVSADQLTKEMRQGNLILLGTSDSNPAIASVKDSMPFTFDKAKSVQSKGVGLTVQDGEDIGVVEIMPSPWNTKRAMLVVTGAGDQGVGWAAHLLSEAPTLDKLHGNVAVVDQNNYLTTLDTRKSSATIASQKNKPFIPEWAQFGLLGAGVLGVAGGVWVLRRRASR